MCWIILIKILIFIKFSFTIIVTLMAIYMSFFVTQLKFKYYANKFK